MFCAEEMFLVPKPVYPDTIILESSDSFPWLVVHPGWPLKSNKEEHLHELRVRLTVLLYDAISIYMIVLGKRERKEKRKKKRKIVPG